MQGPDANLITQNLKRIGHGWNSKSLGTLKCVKLITQRNDSCINMHCYIQLQGWRAHVDLQIILNKKVAVRYMVKYTTKGEKRSDKAMELSTNIMAGDEGDPSFRWMRLMLK